MDTLKLKIDYANNHYLGGTMVWAISLDDRRSAADAVSKSTGRKVMERWRSVCDIGEACKFNVSALTYDTNGGCTSG